MKYRISLLNKLVTIVAMVGFGLPLSFASDHREAPHIYADATADITDFYAFLNPNDASKLVMVININGFAATTSPSSYQFSPKVRYIFNIDNDGDAKVDKKVLVRFGKEDIVSQTMRGYFPGGIVVEGETTRTTQELYEPLEPVIVEGPDGIKMFAGLRDDPFFFDVVASARTFSRIGTFSSAIDRFAGLNISALVVELPLEMVSKQNTPLQIWGSTERWNHKRARWQQVQRVGNPAVKPVFILDDEMKALFNRTSPHQDKKLFSAAIEQATRGLLGGDDDTVDLVFSMIVPDTLKLDPSQEIKYPNGRTLDDDSMDLLFAFNLDKPFVFAPGDLDGVTENDVVNLPHFPYLAPPHMAP